MWDNWCNFFFFFLSSDVSTLQKDVYCKNLLTNWLTRKSTKIVYWLSVENWRNEIDNWFVDRIFISHHDWLIDFRNKKIDRWVVSWRFVLLFHSRRFVLWLRDFLKEFELNVKWNTFIVFKEKTSSLTQIHDHFRWFTIRQIKMKCNHRFQRKNFFIHADSRSFSLTHVVDDFFLTRVFLRVIDDFVLLIRVFRRAICFAKSFAECQLVSQNSEREICCAKDNESSSLRIDKKISCWKCAIVTNWQRFCFFLLVDRHDNEYEIL